MLALSLKVFSHVPLFFRVSPLFVLWCHPEEAHIALKIYRKMFKGNAIQMKTSLVVSQSYIRTDFLLSREDTECETEVLQCWLGNQPWQLLKTDGYEKCKELNTHTPSQSKDWYHSNL